MFTYLASPYSDPDPKVRLWRYEEALNACVHLTRKRYIIYSPIVHFHHAANIHDMPLDAQFWWTHNSTMLSVANTLFILTLPGWKNSVGIRQEWRQALSLPTIGSSRIHLIRPEQGYRHELAPTTLP